MSLKSSSIESSSDELEDIDSLKTELSKLTVENELLRSESSELKAEVEKLTKEMRSWNQSARALHKMHETQKSVHDRTGLGFSSSESSEGETSTQSQPAYDKFNKMSFVKADVIYDCFESITFDDQNSPKLSDNGKAGIGFQRPENSKPSWLKNKLDKDKAKAGSKSFVPNQPRHNSRKEKSGWTKNQPRRDLNGQKMKSKLNRSHSRRPETRVLRQPALEGLMNLERTESPRHADRNKSDHTINGGGGTTARRWRGGGRESLCILNSFLVDWTVKMRTRPPELETSIYDVKYHVSLSTGCGLGKWVYLVTLAMSLFNLQDVCIVIGSLATLDLPMIVDMIGIYVLKGPYCMLTMTNWFLQALSVIPRGSWGDVARRFTMIRWPMYDLNTRLGLGLDHNITYTLITLDLECAPPPSAPNLTAVAPPPPRRRAAAAVDRVIGLVPISVMRRFHSIGYPRMKASGESSTTKHRLLHASGPHPIPPPNDPKLIHSTNGNHLESPNEGSSIDHQAAVDPPKSGPRPEIRLLRQPALEGLTNLARTESPRRGGRNKSNHEGGGTWRRHSGGARGRRPMGRVGEGGAALKMEARVCTTKTSDLSTVDASLKLGRPYPHFDGPID
ncbi:putative tRNA modification GTPase MnmE [Dorcoceras hygrometricum]|uniref:Putative tRNA modification GTPase MnmE n=1 Tax=Dorcoceras hygrometricum TaxID=472368 RepID=A0A2Z7CA06_9LAMI|nr:putative tRNA modification GTPase MnmE [Dorcoceras hygrometricum]